MNKERRKWAGKVQDKLMEAQADIEEIKSEEEMAYDNLPEGIQDSERGEAMQEAIELLEAAYDSVQDAIDNLSELL